METLVQFAVMRSMASLIRDIRPADVALIILLATLAIILQVRCFRSVSQAYVYIHKDNILIGTYPLEKDNEIRIDEHNTIVIHNGSVAMKVADCPDKRCIKQGATKLLPIVCMPNRLVIEIRQKPQDKPVFLLY